MHNAKRDPLAAHRPSRSGERCHLGNRYAIFGVIFTILIFGAADILFDYFPADDRGSRVLAFIYLAALVLVSGIWRSVGTLVARTKLDRREYTE
jgi:hypothetical protein